MDCDEIVHDDLQYTGGPPYPLVELPRNESTDSEGSETPSESKKSDSTVPTRDDRKGKQSALQQSKFFLSDKDPIVEPKIGKIFNGRAQADALLKLYALRTGFAAHRHTQHRFSDDPSSVKFICSRGRSLKSKRPKKNPVMCSGYRQRRYGEHQTLCNTELVIKGFMLNDLRKIISVNLKHNHLLADEKTVRYFPQHRHLPEFVKKILRSNDEAGVPQRQSIKSIAAQCGGSENCTFIPRDMYNEIQANRALNLEGGDANQLMQFFIRRASESQSFFYECQFDMDGRLSRIFWATGRCRMAYRYFGDVITFYTTYLTNKYGISFRPFVGVNQHGPCYPTKRRKPPYR